MDHHDYAELPGDAGYAVISYPLVTGVDLQKGSGSPDTLTLPTPPDSVPIAHRAR